MPEVAVPDLYEASQLECLHCGVNKDILKIGMSRQKRMLSPGTSSIVTILLNIVIGVIVPTPGRHLIMPRKS